MNITLRHALLCCAAALAAGPAMAADDAAAADRADIVVTGLPAAKGDAAYDIVVIDHDRLTGTASNRIEDVLRDVAGFQQFRRTDSRTANPTSQGATLRALGGNASSRALVLLDGAPVADPFAGYIPWFAIAPERLGAVRVTRGAGAGAFGTGALAGTIELQSADAATLPHFQGEVDYGSRNSLSANAVASAQLGAGSASLFGRYDQGDGYIIIPEGQRGPADIPARYRQGSLGFHIAAPLTDDVQLLVNGLAFQDKRVRGIEGNATDIKGASTSVRLLGDGSWKWEALAYLQSQTFSNTVVALDPTRTVATPSLNQYNTPATGLGGKLEVRPPTGDGLELRFGVDVRNEVGRTEEQSRYLLGRFTRLRQGGGHNTVFGGYAEASATPLDRLTLTAGGRIDRWRIADGFLEEVDAQTFQPTINDHPANRTKWQPTGRGGIAYDVTDALKLRTAAYLSYRLPTLNELYRPFRVGADATGSNADLKPERLKGVEIGADFRPLATLRFGVTGFINRLENAIGNVTIGSGPGVFPEVGFVAAGGLYRQRQNLDAIVARGIEAEAHLALKDWRLDASYAYTHARVEASGIAAALDGLRPAQTPTHQASATLGWAPAAGFRAAVTGRYVSGQTEDDLGVRLLGDAATLDAMVEVPLARGVFATLRGENLTNTLIASGVSTTGIVDRGTPRTLTIGVRVAR
ncbi:TonB-dependent receptor [Sphingosinicellaceae bacterium]|nr:TonB-dependent receptor [Sphingosinicellaceae bacterium]